MKKMILVTGGAGYIGSHAVVELLDNGYEVAVIDSLENGFIEFVDKRAKFYQGNVQNPTLMDQIFSENNISAVMHFAGYIRVPESVEDPNKYYLNNTYTTMCLIQSMLKNNIKNIVFSSTAAVYGDITENTPVIEEHSTLPINPYGSSKLMSEKIIIDCSKAYGLNYSIFRYFNVAGAHEKYPIGQKGKGVTSLITLTLQSASNSKNHLNVFGNNFPTFDGTGVRDYIHVVDLVRAHILSLDKLFKNESNIYNLGNENGFSVLEIIQAAKKVTKNEIPYRITERRKGDPACVIASSKRAREILAWHPYYTNIEKIIETAWNFTKITLK
ncbi:UDP-glucose 4-epimerase [Fusobacterium necrophorum]|uniref:UDP-glucose 4-epimerase n=1 Tax=Fusobacterium necrophorum BL TaxID=1441732 RepID=A0AB73BY86_9FUSO|nr:UDP-glucose 4-epimerase GalE [Fusobacterium necrophorum]KDE64737.1 UDP-glucose 4-epimerase [Fusobacterium necrophorum BL]KDE73298.1 UDP-glucose 4-epimerase [Fusobacterium necrophorum BFTR-2]MBR8733643.1 UDP-glucose 4-epimerase [Fusobacterium necrophorum]MBR8789897.1 UDP-glucose 4-epimerase [Fusobacterium necrophorum]SDB17754.1 UDP-glucose 4-epimerase [Fusobacterium necrophorum]